MKEHEHAQKSHYENQYAEQETARDYDPDGDLWEWAKWYPLLVLEEFLSTISGKSLVAICCGAGRELALFGKHGVDVTATDLTIEHLRPLVSEGVIARVDEQNAERLSYEDDSFDYGFVNAGLHHLLHPHAGLNELMRTSKNAAIFIESQDSILHGIGKMFGRNADFEPAGNYVYRWSMREIEKIALSAHAHSFAVKTTFLPILVRMRGVTGTKKLCWQRALMIANHLLSPMGNLLIACIFKRAPSPEQIRYLQKNGYTYKNLTMQYPPYVKIASD